MPTPHRIYKKHIDPSWRENPTYVDNRITHVGVQNGLVTVWFDNCESRSSRRLGYFATGEYFLGECVGTAIDYEFWYVWHVAYVD